MIRRSDYRCKKCKASAHKEWVKTHRKYINMMQKKYYSVYAPKLKIDILAHYSNGRMCCAECGKTDRLSIDHINGNGSKHLLSLGFNSSYQFYLWLRRNHYPKGYRVLCRGCNSRIKSTKGRKCQPTSKLIKRALLRGLSRSKDIADYYQSSDLTRRAILEALHRLTKKGKIVRVGKGQYQLV